MVSITLHVRKQATAAFVLPPMLTEVARPHWWPIALAISLIGTLMGAI
jgi:hypothetical protein